MTPPLDAVVDNDVLIKASAYLVLEQMLMRLVDALDVVGVLGVARFVVTKRLAKQEGLADRQRAAEHFELVLQHVQQLEPSDAEVNLATRIQEQALLRQLPLDVGEAQLFAISAIRDVQHALTGDKRAIAAAEALLEAVAELRNLEQQVVCLEQAVARLTEVFNPLELRDLICANAVDQALAICFRCYSDPPEDFYPDGLLSYINAVRATAPRLLAPGPQAA